MREQRPIQGIALPGLNVAPPRAHQALKRSPINIRRLALVPKTQNPKAIALILSALLKLPSTVVYDREDLIPYMIDRLVTLRSSGVPYWAGVTVSRGRDAASWYRRTRRIWSARPLLPARCSMRMSNGTINDA